MIDLNVETHYIKNYSRIAEYLAQSIASHWRTGKIAVVTSNPKVLMQSTKKKWAELNETTGVSISFTAAVPQDLLDANVTFATLEDFLLAPPSCQILYITQPVERQDLYMLTGWIPRHGRVILYKKLSRN